MSNEEVADVVEAINEFRSTHPWTVLGHIAGLQIEEGSVGERRTYRKPPVEVTPNGETIPIDECLGLYQPQGRRITLFQRGIAAAAGLLGCETENLDYSR